MSLGRVGTLVLATALVASSLTARAAANDDVEGNFVPVFLGTTEQATLNRHVPSSGFAQRMMLSQMRVTELEAGVIATWVPEKDFPHTIFAASDEFEAYGQCTKRETIGCTMDVFDYAAGEVRSYLMPLRSAKRRETYLGLLSSTGINQTSTAP